MLGKVDKRTAQALISLDSYSEWKIVQDWLEAEIDKLEHQLSIEDDEILIRWYQGAIQVLREFFDKKTQARTFINKL